MVDVWHQGTEPIPEINTNRLKSRHYIRDVFTSTEPIRNELPFKPENRIPKYIDCKCQPLSFNNYESFKRNHDNYLFDNSIDSDMALKGLYTGVQLHRMYDAKNALVKKDFEVFFKTELEDNEKRIWWEEHKPISTTTQYNYSANGNKPVDRFRNIY